MTHVVEPAIRLVWMLIGGAVAFAGGSIANAGSHVLLAFRLASTVISGRSLGRGGRRGWTHVVTLALHLDVDEHRERCSPDWMTVSMNLRVPPAARFA